MKRTFLLLVLGLACLSMFSTASFATTYRTGNQTCVDFEAEEKAYYEEEENMHVTLVYAICLLIKGEVTNNPNDVTNGMRILHNLSDDQSNVPASYFIAEYHFKEGTFDTVSNKNLDIAVNYYLKTLAIINTFHNYPPPNYTLWEKGDNIEMSSHYKVPLAYLNMFYFGVAGDYRLRILNSPSYEGTRDFETYPKYNKHIMSYINSAIEYARECKSLPIKAHFKETAPYYMEVCSMYEEKGTLLKDIQLKREQILNEERCNKDVGTWDEICPEIHKLNAELKIIFESITEEANEILYPVRHLIHSSQN